MNRGIIYALSAYIFWGLHPIYWKQLQHVPSIEIVSHRIIWSLVFFSIIISSRKEWKGLLRKIKECKNKWILFVPAILIGSNWALYIWAVNAGYIIETSLGYFISPLISVFLGVFFLNESLRRYSMVCCIYCLCRSLNDDIHIRTISLDITLLSRLLGNVWTAQKKVSSKFC